MVANFSHIECTSKVLNVCSEARLAGNGETMEEESHTRHILPISGKDSLATALIQMRRQSDLPYEFLYNDTGMELPEVESWLSLVENHVGKKIERIGGDLESIMYEQGMLPSHKARYCTRLAKIFPMENWIGSAPATVYYGIRADEHRVGYQSMSGFNIMPVYPLKEEGYTLPMVWQLVTELDLLPPQFFWKEMHERVVRRLGTFADVLLSGLKPWEFNTLFAWRSRPNCYHCYYQALWELVGLLEHHSDLFWHTATIEQEIGAGDRREKVFTLKRNWPLALIAEKKEAIKRKRCIAICKLIAKRASLEMHFEDEPELDEELDMLDIVSCGLFCGK